MEKKRFYINLFISFISLLIIILAILYTISWQRKTHILGSYELKSDPNVQLYFTWDENRYWSVKVQEDEITGEITGKTISAGSYRLAERENFFQRNTFIFEDELGDFEYFTIKNHRLDIIVVIDGVSHIFKKTSNIHVSVNPNIIDN